MTTSFSILPIVDLSVISSADPSPNTLKALSEELHNVFATTGFAYLVNAPLTFTHDEVFSLASEFFQMDLDEKMKLAKRTFVRSNKNTYRGYFPPQPGQLDNLKEGFEVGPSDLSFGPTKKKISQLHNELQSLSSMLLSLLAISLHKPADYFSSYLIDSLSTLRLLHYPPQTSSSITSTEDEVKLCCTPHTDSGILTLLHQDATGGLEVLNAKSEWVPAPYVSGSIVVNIGDLMAEVSGGRFVATMHRVRTNSGGVSRAHGMGRFSVPFFFEPGENCIVRNVDGGEGIVYGKHIKKKMGTWVEYLHEVEDKSTLENIGAGGVAVEAF